MLSKGLGAAFAAITLLFAADGAFATTKECGWEADVGVLATYPEDGKILYSRVTDPVHGGTYALELIDNLESGTPSVYIAAVYDLQAGDVVTAGFWRFDDTPGGAPSCRIWGHWNNSLPEDIMGFDGSAGGNADYGQGTGWDYVDWEWTVPDGVTGLVIEARTYVEPGDISWIDDLAVEFPETATAASACESLPVDPLRVEFSSPNPFVVPGESIRVDYEVENNRHNSEAFDAWINLYVGGSEPHPDNPLRGPFTFLLGPRGRLDGSGSLPIPLDVPPGIHDLQLAVGEFPDSLRDYARFPFELNVGAIDVELTTDSQNVRRGATLHLNYTVANSGLGMGFDAWAEGFEIDGSPSPENPLFGPRMLYLGPNQSLEGDAGYEIPRDTVLGGPYRLCLLAGEYSNRTLLDESCVDYYVMP